MSCNACLFYRLCICCFTTLLYRIEFFSVQTSFMLLLHELLHCDFGELSNACCKCDIYVNPFRVCGQLMLLHTMAMQATNFLPLQLVCSSTNISVNSKY